MPLIDNRISVIHRHVEHINAITEDDLHPGEVFLTRNDNKIYWKHPETLILESLSSGGGKSALELAIEANLLPEDATITDLIAYLKGADGKSALELAIEANLLPEGATLTDLMTYLKGADDGADGKSALELAIEANLLPEGATITDLMAYLKGVDGADGKSALELAIEANLLPEGATLTDLMTYLKEGADDGGNSYAQMLKYDNSHYIGTCLDPNVVPRAEVRDLPFTVFPKTNIKMLDIMVNIKNVAMIDIDILDVIQRFNITEYFDIIKITPFVSELSDIIPPLYPLLTHEDVESFLSAAVIYYPKNDSNGVAGSLKHAKVFRTSIRVFPLPSLRESSGNFSYAIESGKTILFGGIADYPEDYFIPSTNTNTVFSSTAEGDSVNIAGGTSNHWTNANIVHVYKFALFTLANGKKLKLCANNNRTKIIRSDNEPIGSDEQVFARNNIWVLRNFAISPNNLTLPSKLMIPANDLNTAETLQLPYRDRYQVRFDKNYIPSSIYGIENSESAKSTYYSSFLSNSSKFLFIWQQEHG